MNISLNRFVIISLGYIIAHSLTSGFVAPIQTTFLPDVSEQIGLLFLPHGIRVISIYLFGLQGAFLLLPASYLMWFLEVYGNDTELNILAPIISILGCWIGVASIKLIFEIRSNLLDLPAWKFLMLAGMMASVFNAIGLSLLQHTAEFSVSVLGYMIGDVAGLFACLLILMFALKSVRHLSDELSG